MIKLKTVKSIEELWPVSLLSTQCSLDSLQELLPKVTLTAGDGSITISTANRRITLPFPFDNILFFEHAADIGQGNMEYADSWVA